MAFPFLSLLAAPLRAAPSPGAQVEARTLAILDPIDLHTQKPDPDWGEFLRRNVQTNTKWRVISRDTILAKFKDYKIDPHTACHEFQCAFDAGNILSAEFVLFGSVTGLDNVYAYTLNLVHTPTSQVVWSRVGDVRKKELGMPGAALEASLAQVCANLGPDQLRTGRREKRGLLSVLDLSAEGTTPSRMMAERVATHLYASRNYDIMGKKEMEELLGALGINKSAFAPTDSNIIRMGGKMDISNLVYSSLSMSKTGDYQLQLALYDVAEKKKVREWSVKSSDDFRRLLEFEDKFFTSLFKASEYDLSPAANPVLARHWTFAGVGMGVAAATVCGYLAYTANQDADQAYAEFQMARSRQSAESLQSKVRTKERNSLVFGTIGGIAMLGAGVVLAFSF